MKKTIKVNISGTIFHVDEDAFVILENYLNQLKKHFNSKSEGSEIITDIEIRIAELLQLKLSDDKQIIDLDDIQEVMEIMGKPEDIIDPDEPTSENQQTTISSNTARKFYRDLDNNVAGGVCSGLGAHFNIDPIIIRVLFIVLAIPLAAFPVALYLILWIVIPPAITTQQKMDMKGGGYTISDIENSVKNEYHKVKHNFRKFKDSGNYHKTKENLNSAGNGIVEIFSFFGKFILTIIGVAFILAGVSAIGGLFGAFVMSDSLLFWTHTNEHHFLLPDFLLGIINPESVLLVTVCVIIFVAAPLIAIIYWGLKLILRFKAQDKAISIIATVAWILSGIVLLGITLTELKDYAFSTQVDDEVELHLVGDETLYLNSSTDFDNFSEIHFFEEGLNIYTHDDYSERVYLEPNIIIKYTSGTEATIKFEKEARGATNKKARINTENINYNWSIENNTITLDPLYFHSKLNKWAFPELDIIIYLPEGQKICIDKDLDKPLSWANRASGIWNGDLAGKCWIMTPNGLDYP